MFPRLSKSEDPLNRIASFLHLKGNLIFCWMNIVMVGYAIIIQQDPKFEIYKVTKFWSNGIDLLI